MRCIPSYSQQRVRKLIADHDDNPSAPSIMSIKKAMQSYARQGGTSSIFVHDDGLQLIPESDRDERIRFYGDHGIGWVARPKHDDSEGGFKRRGRFKKASNMNYGLSLSLKMEEIIRQLEIERCEKASLAGSQNSSDDDGGGGEDIEEQALRLAVEDIYEESGRRFKPWAHNAKALRMGEVVLIVDSDTIVPEVCAVKLSHYRLSLLTIIIILFHRTVSATPLASLQNGPMLQSSSMIPVSVSCLRFISNARPFSVVDVMQVAHHYFENGIAHFTRRINKCISIACANGEVAPFVGHNAFLRWSALQDSAFNDPGDDDKKKIWSETNVSEDFDMALRLQVWSFVSVGKGIRFSDCLPI